ncbi:3-deoxy-D-manno-octulosonic acid transferase [Rhodobacteraceae bacterium RKSG542]|uniref:3-deoxy-D-manno-octulosonic acid transferase n=1 Tax=Pseudovibrio flavus TaxID=2529854 RepID=UPI0012BCF49E|nr:3-deoxy-D-manno-octulosonic acid transferase [Pseudovibrio flavus]MTI18636.1 3-deoxy-D-manno-octulosonic acid transferase [Pseudovibrio flavus]
MPSILLALYRGLGEVSNPLLNAIHSRRVQRGKEDPSRKNERFGRADIARPDGALIWIHAASVGETMTVLPLAQNVLGQGYKVLLTTGTLTSADTVARAGIEGLIHQFVPYDTAPCVRRFLDHWKPDLAITVESEIWPVIFSELKNREIPLAIINGRISKKTFKGWKRLPPFTKAVLGGVRVVLAQSARDGARFKSLGVPHVRSVGNIKFDGASLDVNEKMLGEFQSGIGERPVWLAASTHPGEEELVMQAHLALKQKYPDLLTIIVPRHPARGALLRSEIEDKGVTVAQRSKGEAISDDIGVYLADTLGELGVFFKLCSIVFMGGSLVPVGGHNILEPAQFDCAILSGREVANNAALFKAFENAEAIVMVDDAGELSREVDELLSNPESVKAYASSARKLFDAGRGALARTCDALAPYLPKLDA